MSILVILKLRAFILTIILGMVIIQPPFTEFKANAAVASCGETEESSATCSPSDCDMPGKKNDCESRCNPLLGCPSGNFYLHYFTTISITSPLILKPKTALVNDNRIMKQLTECWHPPEIS